jgi:hypothetical protein
MMPTFTDATVDRLRALQQEHRDETRRLAQMEATWTALATRTDPAAHVERARLAPALTELQGTVRQISADIAAAERTLESNKAMVAEGVRLMAETEPWLAALLARLPTDADLERAYAESRRYDRLAGDLLVRTECRQFRRASLVFADPYGELHAALTERLHALDRLRALKGAALLRPASREERAG